ncbi:MAG: choice-of-anchor tandem repeat GloVer-containing protein [Chthoniobacterales bacterium]
MAAFTFASIANAASTNVTYSFGGEEDGEYADTDLAIDATGNLYGTTVLGGTFGGGTVFKLAPTPNGWVHTVLYSFTGGADGGEPYKGVTLDAQGNLYGSAVTGGSGSCEGGCGVVYKLTYSGGTWTQSVVHAFTGGDDGSGPGARLTIDNHGALYGMTPTGGAFGAGTIYQIRQNGNGNWVLRVIHAFTGGADGASGSAGQMLLRSGRLYGLATAGGINGKGTAFELRPAGNGDWTFKIIYSFKGQPDAGFPYGGLVFDASGNLYGTTYYDGANNLGAVYKLIPQTTGEWKERVLYSFKGGADGQNSISNVVFDATGNLYGTTSEGGLGSGVIFKLTPMTASHWSETVVHQFQGPPDGAFAYNGMVGDGAGNFFGATVHGGADDEGSVYQFTP